MGAARNSPPIPVHWRVRRRKQQRQVLLIALSALLGLGGLALGSWLRGHQPPTATQVASCEIPQIPPKLSVRVFNGTRRAGLADQVAAGLRARDVDVIEIANASSEKAKQANAHSALILVGTGASEKIQAQGIAKFFPGAKIVSTGEIQDDVAQVVLGQKYRTLNRPQPPSPDC